MFAPEWWVKILSNVNKRRAKVLNDYIDDLNVPQEGKELIIVERRLDYLEKAADQMFGLLKPTEFTSTVISPKNDSSKEYTHHICNDELRICYSPIRETRGTQHIGYVDDPLILFYIRLKGRDNYTEKLTRLNAKLGTLENPKAPGKLIAEDLYGFYMVSPNKSCCYFLRDFVGESHALFPLREITDHLNRAKKTGYSALHQAYYWDDGIPDMEDLIFKAHFAPVKCYRDNEIGCPKNPGAEHKKYVEHRLKKPHDQGNYQIVLVEGQEGIVKEIDNGFAKYHLVE